MTKIYDQYDAAFNRVSAYAILKDGKYVAKVSIKFPADGAGRLYAYVHWLGLQMVRGHATGYGYDKRSAAVERACNAAIKAYGTAWEEATPNTLDRASFFRLLSDVGGHDWTRVLDRAGFAVIQAV